MTEKKVLSESEVLALGENGMDVDEKPSTVVTRPLDQENDLGNLLGSEVNEFQLSDENIEDELKARARDNCQLLLNQLWTLPTGSFLEIPTFNLISANSFSNLDLNLIQF